MMEIKEDVLNRLIRDVQDFSQTDLTSSETNTKKKIIEPLLDMLGWDTRSNDVRLEHTVNIGTSTHHVDYALSLEDKPVLLVEAKAYDSDLTSRYSSQIISYGLVERVRWTVLTNGRVLKIFDTDRGKSEHECLVVELDLTKLPNELEYLKLISRQSILTREIEEASARLLSTRRAITNLRQKHEEIEEEFVKVLLKYTGDRTESRIKEISSQLVRQTVQLLEKRVEVKPSLELEGAIPSIYRKDLIEKRSGEVIICPSKVEGVEFLKKYNAWGFINISDRRSPKYFSLYVGVPHSSVLYFGEIDTITQPLDFMDDLQKISQEDMSTFEKGKRVIHLKPGTLVELEDPIPLNNPRKAPRSLRYTTLGKLIKAEYLEDL
jgi:hypothetical protein